MRGRMALLLGLAMLPAGAIAMQVGLNAVAARQAAFEETLGRRALQSIAVERGTIDEVREMLRVLATSPAMQQIQRGDCREWLNSVKQRYSYLASIGVSDNSGEVLCSVPLAPAHFRAPRSVVRDRAMARNGYAMGYVESGALSHQPVLAAMEPIRDTNGRRIGFIGAAIPSQALVSLLDRTRSLYGARAALADASGFIIAQSTPDEGASPALPSPAQIRNRLGPDPAFVSVRDAAAVIVPLSAPDLYAVMSWPPDQPAWQRWTALSFSLAAPLLIWALAMAAGWFAIEMFVARPLSDLEGAARSYARGEDVVESEALENAPDEIRALRRTMAAMAKTLRGREQRLMEALGEERALLREVHHRVKNNLQMVASLLNIQARGAKDESEAWGLARAHDRVQLLALVHQRIYSSGELRELRLDDLIAEISRQLVQGRGTQSKDLRLAMHLSPARADTDHAMPLTFLVGEAISFALDCCSGKDELGVWLEQDDAGEMRFAVDCAANANGAPGPGGRLIDAFARQLGADIGRDPARPAALWVRVPPTQHA
ncbi:MAG: histidine kinase dimerization/phosphoacceptor domain -containing protein [Vitreimonas sp.]